jgi:DNA-nicking Smr family endonuclease
MKKKSHLTDDDRAVWKAVTAVIEPHTKTAAHQKKRKHKADEEPRAERTAQKSAPPKPDKNPVPERLLRASGTERTAHKTAELPHIASDVFSNIKAGKRKVDARIDLHGMTQEVAHRKAIAFLTQAHARGLKTVLVITGKGKGAVAVAPQGAEQSHQNGVLQKNLPRWLHADAGISNHIAGINAAPRELGGSGAYVITLKKR